MKILNFVLLISITFILVPSCGKDETPTTPVANDPETNQYGDINNTMGFELLNKIFVEDAKVKNKVYFHKTLRIKDGNRKGEYGRY